MVISGIPNYYFDVKRYGARGDNFTDDTVAIQAAIDACSADGGGIVLLSKGNYIVSSPIIIEADNVSLIGQGARVSVIKNNVAGNKTLRIGSLSTSSSGKANDITLSNFAAHHLSNATQDNIEILGVTRLLMKRVDAYRGVSAITLTNADQTHLEHNSARVTASNAIGIKLIQGQTHDVTTCSVMGGIIDVTGSGGVCLQLDHDTGVSANPNEFNDILFSGIKFDGNNTATTTGIKALTGLRNTVFQTCEFKELRSYSFDMASALLGGQKIFFKADSCKILGNSSNPSTAHFYIDEPSASGSSTEIDIINCQMHRATTGVLVKSGTPFISLNRNDAADLTNWLEIETGATPRFEIGSNRLSSTSVTNKVGTVLGAGSATYYSLGGNRNGDFKVINTGSGTITNGSSNVNITHGLDYTPTNRDIQIVFNSSAGLQVDGWNITNITSTQFRVNIDPAAAADITFQWKVVAN